MARITKFIGIGLGAAIVLVAVAVLAVHYSTAEKPPPPPPPQAALVDPSLSPSTYPARYLAMPVDFAIPDLQPQQGATCSAGAALYTLRCVFNFTDAARYNQTDQLVVYTLTNDSDFAALKSRMEKTLFSLPNSQNVSEDKTYTLQDSAGNDIAHIKATCEQEAGDHVLSDAVCIAHYAPGIAVATAIYPESAVDGHELDVDFERVELLEASGLSAVDGAIGVP